MSDQDELEQAIREGMPSPDFALDPEFFVWLKIYLPDYNLEYSGDIKGLHDAWLAGRKLSALEREVVEAAVRWAETGGAGGAASLEQPLLTTVDALITAREAGGER